MWIRRLAASALAASVSVAAHAQLPAAARRAMTFEDVLMLKVVGDPQLSPDGRWRKTTSLCSSFFSRASRTGCRNHDTSWTR